MSKVTQNQTILDHLKSGRSITAVESVDLYRCYRLGAVILQLRKQGYDIVTNHEKNSSGTGTHARYEYRGANQ